MYILLHTDILQFIFYTASLKIGLVWFLMAQDPDLVILRETMWQLNKKTNGFTRHLNIMITLMLSKTFQNASGKILIRLKQSINCYQFLQFKLTFNKANILFLVIAWKYFFSMNFFIFEMKMFHNPSYVNINLVD